MKTSIKDGGKAHLDLIELVHLAKRQLETLHLQKGL
jgi:hypothetical protein